MKSLVDGVDEANASGKEMKGADAAIADAMNAVGDFVMYAACGEDGPITTDGFGFVEPTLHTALVSVQTMSYLGIHSKSLSAGEDGCWLHHLTPEKTKG